MGRSGNPGRGGGLGSGRGGRGKGGWNKKKNSNSDKKETTNKKYLFTLLQSTVDVRVSAYETTLKKMYQQLMKDIKTYPEDVIDSLKSEKKKDVKNHEKMKTAKPADKSEEAKEEARLQNEAYKLDFVNREQDARMRERTLDSNLRVAYNIIFSNFCDKELQSRLEHKENFNKDIENDPFNLLAAIKEMMHTTSHEKLIYPFETLWTSLAALFKLKQEKEEKLSDYYDKMKAFSVQVKKYLPDEVLHQFVEGLDMYQKEKSDLDKQKEMKKGAWNQMIALGFLYNSDCERYGKLLKDYQTDFADSKDIFPKDLVNMRERMSIACNEDKFLKKKNKDKDNKDKGKDTNSNENVTYASSFAQVVQGKKVCWVCGGDHLANVCPHRAP